MQKMGKIAHTESKQYLSITEAAEFLGVSRPTIFARLNSGALPYNQVSSRTIRIPIAALTSIQADTHPTKKNRHLTAHDLFFTETYPNVKEWYTSEELSKREGISRKHICATAHKLGIPVKRGGTVCYIAKEDWDNRKLAPSIL